MTTPLHLTGPMERALAAVLLGSVYVRCDHPEHNTTPRRDTPAVWGYDAAHNRVNIRPGTLAALRKRGLIRTLNAESLNYPGYHLVTERTVRVRGTYAHLDKR